VRVRIRYTPPWAAELPGGSIPFDRQLEIEPLWKPPVDLSQRMEVQIGRGFEVELSHDDPVRLAHISMFGNFEDWELPPKRTNEMAPRAQARGAIYVTG
jgi:hypothetical protein